MNRDKILEKVKSITIDQLGIKEKDIKEEASFIDDFGADSLDSVELAIAFEGEFGIEISDEDVEKNPDEDKKGSLNSNRCKIKTVKDAVDYIEKRLKEKKK